MLFTDWLQLDIDTVQLCMMHLQHLCSRLMSCSARSSLKFEPTFQVITGERGQSQISRWLPHALQAKASPACCSETVAFSG